MKFSIKDFFSKCDQTEFIFRAVIVLYLLFVKKNISKGA